MDSAEEIEVLSCTVSGVIYKNDENGYAILKVQDEDGADRTITGTIPYAWPGETLTAYGHWVNRAGHGRQFEVESTVREEPEGSRAAFLYLSSGAVKGIGPALAGQIVTKFGDRALFVIEEEPERLAEIKGIGSGRAKTISEEYCRQVNLKKLVLLLNESGVLPEYAIRFYRFFGDRSIDMLKENPYLLTMDGVQAPFAAADRLAEELGITDSDPNRIRAGIRFVLQHNEKNGHCFIPYGKLLPAAAKQLGIDPEEIGTVIEDMTAEQSLIREAIAGEDACYLPDMYRAECTAASHLARLAGQPQRTLPNLEELVDACEREQGIHYAEQQREILRAAAGHAVLAVTGGPGTGKTTSLRGVLKLYGRMGLRTLLAAPTGRAAKRMSELTGAEAATIHRLLGAKLSETGMEVVFSRNRDNPLSCDAVIVDECSMVDIRLMASLLEALPKKVRLVLVGDAAQLPSVGPGNVFSAILRSGVVPTVRLTAIFRQQDGSRIVRNAHMINKG
nr:AAA family ATPase [Oscillospiraceae bacterium]